MQVGNGHNLDNIWKVAIKNTKRKSPQQYSANAVNPGRPAFRRLGNQIDRANGLLGKSRSRLPAARKIPLKSSFVFACRFFVKFNFLTRHG